MNSSRDTLMRCLTFVIIAFAVQACGQKIDARQTQTKQGLIYKMNADDPFSGTVTNVPSIGQKSVRKYGHGNCTLKFKNGLRDGMSSCIAENGTKVSEIEFTADEMNGIQKQWESSGTLVLSMRWKNGQPDGLEEVFDPSTGKRVVVRNWSNGVQEGEEKGWDSTGEKQLTDLIWKNGKATGFQTVYNLPGGGYSEYNLKEGLRDGIQKTYATNGIGGGIHLWKIETYKAGKLEGLRQEFYDNGKIASEMNFRNGELDGLEKKYRLDSGGQEQCLDAKIAAFRNENGAEAIVSIDMLEEWKSQCPQ